MSNVVDGQSYVIGYVSSPHPHGPLHVKTLDALPEIEAVRFCGIEGEDIESIAAETAKTKSTTASLQDLLAHDDLDALMVCVRNDLCPAVLEAAVDAGLPVLFEKPGAIRAADLRQVADRARTSGITLGAMYQNRGNPIMAAVRDARQKGALGSVMAVEARMVSSQVRYRDPSHWLFGKKTAGSGILSWLACHYIDLLCYLMDDRIAEVTAITATQNSEAIEVEDTACLAFRFAGGALGTLNAGYHLSGSQSGYTGAAYDTFVALRGTDGHVRIPLSSGSGYSLFSIAPGWASGGMQEHRYEPAQSPAYGGVTGEEFVEAFLAAARMGSPAPATVEDAVHVLDVIEAALESSKTGRLVKVKASGVGRS